jgi:hypothetical protein
MCLWQKAQSQSVSVFPTVVFARLAASGSDMAGTTKPTPFPTHVWQS